MGCGTVQKMAKPKLSGASVVIVSQESGLESSLTNVEQAQIVNDLTQILDRLDELELWLAAVHLSSSIDVILEAGEMDQVQPKTGSKKFL